MHVQSRVELIVPNEQKVWIHFVLGILLVHSFVYIDDRHIGISLISNRSSEKWLNWHFLEAPFQVHTVTWLLSASNKFHLISQTKFIYMNKGFNCCFVNECHEKYSKKSNGHVIMAELQTYIYTHTSTNSHPKKLLLWQQFYFRRIWSDMSSG